MGLQECAKDVIFHYPHIHQNVWNGWHVALRMKEERQRERESEREKKKGNEQKILPHT